MAVETPTVAYVLSARAPGLKGAGTVPTAVLSTPIGPMISSATDAGVCLLEFTDRRALGGELEELSDRFDARFVPAEGVEGGPATAHLSLLARELAAYFAGSLRSFTVALDAPGTDFEKRTWAELVRIPYGTTLSYGALAARIGNPAASRAVGRANGRNRVAIVIPCHRVIQENGALCGYGGGLDRKRALLELERSAGGADGLLFS